MNLINQEVTKQEKQVFQEETKVLISADERQKLLIYGFMQGMEANELSKKIS